MHIYTNETLLPENNKASRSFDAQFTIKEFAAYVLPDGTGYKSTGYWSRKMLTG